MGAGWGGVGVGRGGVERALQYWFGLIKTCVLKFSGVPLTRDPRELTPHPKGVGGQPRQPRMQLLPPKMGGGRPHQPGPGLLKGGVPGGEGAGRELIYIKK